MAEYGTIGIAEGLQGFAKGLMDAEDRKLRRLEFDARMKSMEKQEENRAFQEALELRKAGLVKRAEGGFDEAPRSQREIGNIRYEAKQKGLNPTFDAQGNIVDTQYDPEYLQMKREERSFDPYGLKGLQADKMRRDIQNKQGSQNRSPIPGFEKGPDYVSDPKGERDLKKGFAETQKFNSILDSLKSRVKNAQRNELINPYSNTSKAIKNDLRDLQLLYKSPSFASLGVLTGPDLRILEEVIENPGSVSNLISGKDGVLSRYDQLQQKVNQGMATAASAYGLVPTGLVQQPGLVLQPAQSAPAPDQNAKLKRLQELRSKAAAGGR